MRVCTYNRGMLRGRRDHERETTRGGCLDCLVDARYSSGNSLLLSLPRSKLCYLEMEISGWPLQQSGTENTIDRTEAAN